MSYIPVQIQKLDLETETWAEHLQLHALQVNKAGGSESFAAGAGQYHLRLAFDFRWCQALEDLRYAPQLYRIHYRGHSFNILDYDDYMESRLTVRLVGEAYE